MSNPPKAPKLPKHYYKHLLTFCPKESQKDPGNEGFDHRIERLGPDVKLQMTSIY